LNFFRKYIGDLYISRRWYLLLGGCVLLLFTSFFVHILYQPAVAVTSAVLALTVIEYILLFFVKGGVSATRIMSPRFSIGDDNTITLSIVNSYPFKITCTLIDELPFQFQERNFQKQTTIRYH